MPCVSRNYQSYKSQNTHYVDGMSEMLHLTSNLRTRYAFNNIDTLPYSFFVWARIQDENSTNG